MRERGDERICGTCRWHCKYRNADNWVCVNRESDYYTDFTDYEDSCEDWERRREK